MIGALSRAKAREILHHGSVRGHPLTDKQRRFFGYMSSHYGDTNGDWKEVITLLNARTRDATRKAVRILEQMYDLPSESVGLFFSNGDKRPASQVYPPYRTAYANAKRIVICKDVMSDGFNAIHSKTVQYDSAHVSHYAVVVLHEFAHVLDKRGLFGNYGGNESEEEEKTADDFAQEFIKYAGF